MATTEQLKQFQETLSKLQSELDKMKNQKAEPEFKVGDWVICINQGTHALDWKLNKVYQIGKLSEKYFMPVNDPHNSGIWLNSIRHATQEEILRAKWENATHAKCINDGSYTYIKKGRIYPIVKTYAKNLTLIVEDNLQKMGYELTDFEPATKEEFEKQNIPDFTIAEGWFIGQCVALITGEIMLAEKQNRKQDFTETNKAILKNFREVVKIITDGK